MIELPESYVLASQINETIVGKIIKSVSANTRKHKFATFSGDPSLYDAALSGKEIVKASFGADASGDSVVMIQCSDPMNTIQKNPLPMNPLPMNTLPMELMSKDLMLVINTSIRYHAPGVEVAPKHQLLIEFEDSSKISFIVNIWGSMLCVPLADSAKFETKPGGNFRSPLDDTFNIQYFMEIFEATKPSLSSKVFLTTEQRFPGIGNGAMHDIFFNARIHPKRKIMSYKASNKDRLFHSIKSTLWYMAERGGRDTELDLFGKRGGYKTILSSKSSGQPCRNCKSLIIKEMYLGGNIYYCPECQPIYE